MKMIQVMVNDEPYILCEIHKEDGEPTITCQIRQGSNRRITHTFWSLEEFLENVQLVEVFVEKEKANT